MPIYAAGALLWHEVNGELLVAMIHRARRNDWSWPKGKLDPGETLPQTAVREIHEETGLKIKLGPFLDVMKYHLPSGQPKEVHYWSARVSDAALRRSTFVPGEEVAKVEWKTPEEARVLLTYSVDHNILDKFLVLHEAGLHKTKPVIILRHAKATPRADWKGGKNVDDGMRPLLPAGFDQAKRLVPLLSAFGPTRVVTSPWERCFTTVYPYAKSRKLTIVERSQLSELGNKKGPKRTKKVVNDVIEENSATVLCSHRPALPTILDTFAPLGEWHHVAAIKEAADLKPAEMLVIHIAKKGDERKIVSVERHTTETPPDKI